MERTITFQVPEGLAGVDVRADTQVAIHAGDWMAFRDVRYAVFTPVARPSLDITPKEYAELALADALLRP